MQTLIRSFLYVCDCITNIKKPPLIVTEKSHKLVKRKKYVISNQHQSQKIAACIFSITAYHNSFSPLIHSSFAPIFFPFVKNQNLSKLLLNSNSIEWLNELNFDDSVNPVDIIIRLKQTQYSSSSIRKIEIQDLNSLLILNFIQKYCKVLEELCLINIVKTKMSVKDILPYRNTMKKFVFQGDLDPSIALVQFSDYCSDEEDIPSMAKGYIFPTEYTELFGKNSGQLRNINLLHKMSSMVHLELTGIQIFDDEFIEFREMSNLRHLKLFCVSELTGEFFDIVFPKLTLHTLIMHRCPDFYEVGGIRHLEFLEHLSLSDILTESPRRDNFRRANKRGFVNSSKWRGFPFLKKLELFANTGFYENVPFPNFFYPTSDEINEYKNSNMYPWDFPCSLPMLEEFTFATRTINFNCISISLKILQCCNPENIKTIFFTPKNKINSEILNQISKFSNLETILFRSVDFVDKEAKICPWNLKKLNKVSFILCDLEEMSLDFLCPCVNIENFMLRKNLDEPAIVYDYKTAVEKNFIPYNQIYFPVNELFEDITLLNFSADTLDVSPVEKDITLENNSSERGISPEENISIKDNSSEKKAFFDEDILLEKPKEKFFCKCW